MNCERAKQLCNQHNVEYKFVIIGQDITPEQLEQLCPEPIRTIPQVFDDDQYIGGYADLYHHLN